MVDIEKSMSIESGMSFDDHVGMFYGTDNPTLTFIGNVTEAPVGSIYVSKVNGTATNIFQRWNTGDYDWRQVFFGETPVWGGKLIALFWAEPVINKRDWFSVGAAIGENAAYLFPFSVTIREIIIIIMAQEVSSSTQDLLLKVVDSPDRVLYTFPKIQQETVVTAVDLNWVVPAGKEDTSSCWEW